MVVAIVITFFVVLCLVLALALCKAAADANGVLRVRNRRPRIGVVTSAAWPSDELKRRYVHLGRSK